MTNRYNRWIYRLWAPFYDRLLDWLFGPARRRAMELLQLKSGERVLLLGVGTGSELLLLPEGVSALGIDLSPEMLARARAKLPLAGREITLMEGDAQQPRVPEGSFDAVVLSLILSVVPDGAACLRAAMGALKPGGRAVIFDKFAQAPGLARQALNLLTSLLGTDITRSFARLAASAGCTVLHEEPSILMGAYRIALVSPKEPSALCGDAR